MKKTVFLLIINLLINTSFFAQQVPCYHTSTTTRIDKQGEKYAFVNLKRAKITEYIYDDLYNFSWFTYALAKRDNSVFLVDTEGKEYLITENIYALNNNVSGINLCYRSKDKFPYDILKYNQLEFILLSDNSIEHIPEKIGDMKKLKFLDLCSNNLKTIPTEIAGLHNLEYITLNHNFNLNWPEIFNVLKDHSKNITISPDTKFLYGDPDALHISVSWSDIDLNDLSVMQNLTQICVMENPNSDTDKLFKDLKNFKQKIIISNRPATKFCGRDTLLIKISPYSEISTEIGNLKNLLKVDLEKVRMPEGKSLLLSSFANISSLILIDCELNIMPEIENYTELDYLDLSNNYIEEIPQINTDLIKLTYLNLSLNKIHDFSLSYEKFPNLRALDLSGNELENIYPDIKKLKNLQILNLSGNDFIDFPHEIIKLANLKELDLSENFFEKIPKEIVKLKKLEKLDLSDTDIFDLPLNLNKLTSLKLLNLKDNNLNSETKKRIKASLPNCKINF